MSRDLNRKGYYNNRDPRNRDRERDRDWNRPDFRNRPLPRKSRSPMRNDIDKRLSRSPRKPKDLIDDNILSEISKLPEPSELWDNQFQDGGNYAGAPPPPSFQPEGVPNSTYPPNYQQPYTGIYDDFPSLTSLASVSAAPHQPDISSWNQMSLPPPPTSAPPAQFITNSEDQMKKEAAIESEMRHQKAALSKQREDYMKKAGILKKELDTLKDQRNELRGDAKRSPSPDTKRFLKENTKLQLEIQNKLKTINNVVDMLNGIIGEEAQEIHDSDDSTERSSKRKSRSPSMSHKFNYIYYDPEMHWCRVCNEFPPTAKDYLNHLHSPAHHKMAAAHMEAPWHSVTSANEGFPSFPSAPTKRTPIRGLQFFVPSTAWYCKLCDQFIGDLHCASAHLKSITHSKNYTNFVELNPHWETDWMSDRQKAFEKVRASSKSERRPAEEKPQYTAHTITFNKDGFHTKRKDSPPPPSEEKKKKKDKKKKNKRKRSSSSSSSSNSSSSDSEPVKKKKSKKKEKAKMEPDDKTLTEWVSALQADRLNDSDRKLLDSLKRIQYEKMDDEKRRSPARSRDRERSEDTRKNSRESERESRGREGRDLRDGRDRRRDERHARRTSPQNADSKKPEIRKMPFIGKMPVYKHLGKSFKTEEQKKDEQKKKEEDEATKKRREEMDAEIQKKVAEFKEKIAQAQEARAAGYTVAQVVDLKDRMVRAQDETALVPAGPPNGFGAPAATVGPPTLALPTALGGAPPQYVTAPAAPPPQPQVPTPAPPPANLPKDFQDALDIIFPSEVKADLSQTDIFSNMAAGLPPGFPMGLGGVMPPFPPFLQPQMPPQMMMGFDLNSTLFPSRAQLYDTQVPLVPSPKPRHNNKMRGNNRNNMSNVNNKTNNQSNQKSAPAKTPVAKDNGSAVKKKEELDELAMLGIDASDVGANI